jgi:hypothetical protein
MSDAYPEMTVQEAASAIKTATKTSVGAVVVVDFDETLWLRNSTEEYLRSLRPVWLAYILLLVLEIARPWRFASDSRGERLYRDWLRVLVCTVCMPWSLTLWRRQAQQNAERWTNRRLLSLLKEAEFAHLRVATLGIDVLVQPILAHIDPEATICAAGTLWSGYRIKHVGKRTWIEQRHSHIVLAEAVVITDSENDADLLGSCKAPILVKWPEAEYRPAMQDAYIPFLYTQRAKRPGANYMLYGVLLEDIVVLWLAFAWLMPSPLLGGLALLLLHLSFWAVYEIGYVENDTRAIKSEAIPKTYAVAASYARRIVPWKAWLVSGTFGAAGTGLLVASNATSLTTSRLTDHIPLLMICSFGIWMLYLAGSRLAFWLYNRLDVQSRGHFYVVLQLLRSIGYTILVYTNLVGAIILLSLVLGRWIKYLVYRSAGKAFDEDQRFLTLMFYLLLLGGGLAAEGAAFLTLQAFVALVWFAAYTRRRLREVLKHVKLAQNF